MIDLKTLRPNQLGYVYKNIEKPAREMEKFLGASKFIIFDPVEIELPIVNLKRK